MAGSNFIQWNPTAANQETDSQYAADSQRSGGATNPSVFDARLANKLFFQLSTAVAALCQAMANKGFTMSDASLASLTTQFQNILTTADGKSSMRTVTYAANLVLDCSLATGFYVVLTGNVTSITILNYGPGTPLTIAFAQDSVGGRTVAFPGSVSGGGSVYPSPFSTSVQQFQCLPDDLFHALTPMVVS